MRRSEANYSCAIEITLKVIGGKWKCVILWWLRQETRRFSELKQLMPGITQKVLTQQLRELEADGLICRQTCRDTPPRVEYSLTPYGETVRPITELMCRWGKAHQPDYGFTTAPLDSLRVLLVSNKSGCDLLEALESYGIRTTVIDLQAAIAQFNQLQPDAVLVDIDIFDISDPPSPADPYSPALVEQIKAVQKNFESRDSSDRSSCG
jgi:DNA-binding HxlR family transcriptional regulator